MFPPGLTSWRAIIGSTRVQSRSNAKFASGVSRAVTTLRCTWKDIYQSTWRTESTRKSTTTRTRRTVKSFKKKCDRNWEGCREEQDAFSLEMWCNKNQSKFTNENWCYARKGDSLKICSQGFQHVHYRFWIRITVTRLLAEVKEKSSSNKPVLFHLGVAGAAGGDDERHRRWTNNDPARSQPHGAIDHNLSTNILWILAASRRLCHYYAIPCLFSPSLVIDWILCQWPSQWKL